MLARSSYTEADERRLEIVQRSYQVEWHFLEIGRLLCRARDQMDWSVLGHEDFMEYIAEVLQGHSWNYAGKLMGIIDHIDSLPWVNEKALALMGMTKLTRLLPTARAGDLTPEFWEEAMVLRDMDLRRQLGHKVGELKSGRTVTCPQCGYEIFVGAKGGQGAD